MITHSPEETIQLARNLARHLHRGDVIALYGELGSGKTTFTKGIGEELGVRDSRQINSPTFVLIKEYKAKIPIYHIDLYRLNNLKEIEDIAIEEYINGDGVVVIEWAEKIKEILPPRYIAVRFIIKGEQERGIEIEDFRH